MRKGVTKYLKSKILWLVIVISAVACLVKVQEAQTARSAYDSCWKLTGTHFLYTERLANWAQWRHKFDNQIYSADDAIKYSNIMLSSLKDPYTELMSAEESAKEKETTHGNTHGAGNDATEDGDHVLAGRREGLGYIYVPNFMDDRLLDEFDSAVTRLSDCPGIVIDLRDNPGGQLDNTRISASLFMTDGVIAKVKFIHQNETIVSVNKRVPHIAAKKAIVVLVNGNTMSCAETFAAALADNGRAKVVGTHTFGKGILQNIHEVPGELLIHITEGRWNTPSGKWVGPGDGKGPGLIPDVVCPQEIISKLGAKSNGQLDKAFEVLKQEVSKQKVNG